MQTFKVALFNIFLLTGCASKKPVVAEAQKELTIKAVSSPLRVAKRNLNKFGDKSESDSVSFKSSSTISSSTEKKYFLYGAEHLNLKNNYFDIPVVYNKAVKKWMSYFLNRGKNFFIRYTERSGRYAPILAKILEAHGLPKDLIFLAMAESGFMNTAKSWAKAVGPWQFMPYTGKQYGLDINWYIDERRDPIKATIAASKYLKKLKKIFGSWELAAAAYNAGPGKIGRAIKRYDTENFWKLRRRRYLKAETKNYIPKIMAMAIIGKNLSSFGLTDVDFQEPLDFDEIDIPGGQDLIELSNALGLEFAAIQKLNPEILRWQTPTDKANYKLRVPVGFAQTYEECCKKKDFTAYYYQMYSIRGSRASLAAVGRKFKLPLSILQELNPGLVKKHLKRGDKVRLPFRQGQSKKATMYADLYERPRKSLVRRRRHRRDLKVAMRRGKLIKNPSEFYVVQRGDTLWKVSKKLGVGLNTLIRSNSSIVLQRHIRAGDKLVIR